jgi:hypothetical protein
MDGAVVGAGSPHDPVLYGFIKSIGTGFSSNFNSFEDDTTSHARWLFNFFQ